MQNENRMGDFKATNSQGPTMKYNPCKPSVLDRMDRIGCYKVVALQKGWLISRGLQPNSLPLKGNQAEAVLCQCPGPVFCRNPPLSTELHLMRLRPCNISCSPPLAPSFGLWVGLSCNYACNILSYMRNMELEVRWGITRCMLSWIATTTRTHWWNFLYYFVMCPKSLVLVLRAAGLWVCNIALHRIG